MHREPDNIWRFDYQLDPNIAPEEALKPENLNKAVNDQLKMIGQDHLRSGKWTGVLYIQPVL